MKKFLFIAILCLFALPSFGTINESKVNYENGVYTITNVVQYDTISANDLYDNVRVLLSDITLEDKSEGIIDYANNESHTIVIKGKLYIGHTEFFLGKNCWNIFLNYTTTIKIKNNKLQCSTKFNNTFLFDYTANDQNNLEIPVDKCFPDWTFTKKEEKSIHRGNWATGYELAIKPNMEKVIKSYQMYICNKLDNLSVEDDF